MEAAVSSFHRITFWRRWFTVGLVLLFVGLSVQYTAKVAFSERDNRSAFLRWRDQIINFESGVNVYDRHNYPNPPIMALLLQPLMSLPPIPGSLLWFYLKVGMVFLIFHWVFRLVEQQGRPFPFWAKVVTIVLSLRPMIGDLSHGNINLFILLLLVSALYAFQHRRDFSAGVVLALAVACKVTPALFIPYFLWKRAWVALTGCVFGLVLFLLLVPGLFLGMERNAFLLQRWTDQMIVPFLLEGDVTSVHNNQSLPGLLYRLTTVSPSFMTYQGDTMVPVEYHNLLDLPPLAPQLILKFFVLLFAGAVICTCRNNLQNRHDWKLAAEYSLIVLGMLLFSERTWKHHCVTLVLPFSVLMYALAVHDLSARMRRYLVGTLIAVCLLTASTSSGLWTEHAIRGAKLAQVYGAYVWSFFLLIAAIVFILRVKPMVAESSDTSFTAATDADVSMPACKIPEGPSSAVFLSPTQWWRARASALHQRKENPRSVSKRETKPAEPSCR